MKFELHAIDSEEYRGALANAEHDFYHFPEYQALCARLEQAEATVACVGVGEKRAWLPLLLRNIPGTQLRDATSAYGYPGPLYSGMAAADLEFQQEAWLTLSAELARRDVISVFVRTHPLLNASLPNLSAVGQLQTHGETVYIDCAEPYAKQWSQMEGGHKNHINRAKRLGHVAKVDSEWQHFEDFYRIYTQNMQRVSATRYYYFPREYFLSLREALGPHLELAVVQIDGSIASAGLFSSVGDIVQYHLSGSDEQFLRLTPMKTLVHFVRERCIQRKQRWFHLGGGLGGEADSLFAFKAGFSRHRSAFRTLRIVTDKAAYAQLTQERAPALSAADLSGFFPAYRR